MMALTIVVWFVIPAVLFSIGFQILGANPHLVLLAVTWFLPATTLFAFEFGILRTREVEPQLERGVPTWRVLDAVEQLE